MTGNGYYVKRLKICIEKITHGAIIFGGFEPFETTAACPPYFSLIQWRHLYNPP
jgi:hypothetical protein